MAKPTILQAILRLPSQSYQFPADKQYYSSRSHMLRVAAALAAEDGRAAAEEEEEEEGGENVAVENSRDAATRRSITLHYHRQRDSETDDSGEHHDNGDSGESSGDHTDNSGSRNSSELFYTPTTSPRVSRAFSAIPMSPSVTEGSTSSLSSTLAMTTEDVPSLFSDPPLASTAPSSFPGSCASSSSSHRVRTKPRRPPSYYSERYNPYTDQDWAKDVRWLVPPESLSSPPKHRKRAYISPAQSISVLPPVLPPIPSIGSLSTHTFTSSPLKPGAKSLQRAKLATTAGSVIASAVPEDPNEGPLARGETQHRRAHTRAGSLPIALEASPPPRARSRTSHSPPSPVSPANEQGFHLRPSSPTPTSLMTLPQGRLPVVSFPDPSPSSVDLPSYGTPGYTSLTMARARAPILKSSNCNTVSGHVDLTRSGLAQTTMATIEVVRGISTSRSLLSFGKKFRPSTSPGPGVLRDNIESGMGFTSYREPPRYVPSGSVLVQVWAVGVDIVDWRIARRKAGASVSAPTKHHAWSSHTSLIRTGSMKSVLSFARSTVSSGRSGKDSGKPPEIEKERKPEVGFIPGRSFVGRVMEFGWEVKETEGGKRGKWVIGLGDIRKSGALAEFIVVDRRRICVVGPPYVPPLPSLVLTPPPSRTPSPTLSHTSTSIVSPTPARTGPTLEELALIPLCGIPAYRVMRTFDLASKEGSGDAIRVLVLGGLGAVGGIVGRLLVARGCRVVAWTAGWQRAREIRNQSVWASSDKDAQAPLSGTKGSKEEAEASLLRWGCEEVLFGNADWEEEDEGKGAVKILEELLGDSEAFDAVLDCVGGKNVWEAAERLLSLTPSSSLDRASIKQFTTVIGDSPERPIPSAVDHYKAGVRSRSASVVSGGNVAKEKGAKTVKRWKVGYSWVNPSQDVDFDGEDVRSSIAGILQARERRGGLGLGLDDDARTWTGAGTVIPFERAPEVFVGGEVGKARFCGGGVAVIRVVG